MIQECLFNAPYVHRPSNLELQVTLAEANCFGARRLYIQENFCNEYGILKAKKQSENRQQIIGILAY
jgi:hypothetical protein